MSDAPSQDGVVRIRLAGELRIEGPRTAEEPEIAGRRARLAFGMLVLERGRAIPREEIAAVLWGESPPASWAPSLREVMSKVRAFLNAAALPSSELLTNAFGCYQLNLPPGTEIDLERAERAVAQADSSLAEGAFETAAELAAEAEAVLSRPLLPGFEGEWLERRRHELDSLRSSALDGLAEALTALGRGDEAVRAAEASLHLNRFSDRAHLALINGHVAAGGRALALRSYEEYRRLMSTELGAGPSPEIEARFTGLLREEAEEREETSPERVGRSSQPKAPLAGRQAERRHLAQRLDDTAEGDGSILIVTGSAGLGKSALVEDLAVTAARRGAKVLIGRSDDMGLAPYRLLSDALGASPADTAPGASGDPALIFEALAESLAERAKEATLLLILEDLHLADPSTLAALVHLQHNGSTPPGVLIVGTCRTSLPARIEEAEQRLDQLLAESPSLALEPLDEGAVAELAESFGLDARRGGLAATLHRETGGNPLHAIEAIRHLAETGLLAGRLTDANVPFGPLPLPATLAEVVFARFSRLPQPTRQLLEAVAVAGDQCDAELAQTITGWDSPAVENALQDATVAGFATPREPTSQRICLAHDSHRQAILDRLPRSRLRSLSATVATALETLGRGAPDRLADLWAEALPGDSRSAAYAQLAGMRAMDDAAYVEAIAWFRVALEQDLLLGSSDGDLRLQLLVALGDALKRNGEVARAESAYLEAAELARSTGRPDRLAEVAFAFAGFNRFEPSISPASVAMLEEAITSPPGSLDPSLEVRLLARKAQFSGALGGGAELGEVTNRALDLAEGSGDTQTLLQALAARLHALGGPERAGERLQVADRLLGEVDGTDEIEVELLALEHRIWALTETGRHRDATAEIDRFAGMARRLRIPAIEMFAAEHGAYLAMIEGRFADCERFAERVGAAAGRSADPRMSESSKIMFQIVPRWLQGTFHTLAAAIEAIVAWQPGIESFAAAGAFAQLSAGDREGAADAMDRLLATGDLADEPHGSLWPVNFFYHAALAAELGGTGGERIYERGLPYSGMHCVYRGTVYFGAFDHHLGVMAGHMGQNDAARRHLGQAIERYESMSATPWLELAEGALETLR